MNLDSSPENHHSRIWVYPNPHDPKARNPYLRLLYQGQQVCKLPRIPFLLLFAFIHKTSFESFKIHHHWFEFRSTLGFIRILMRLMFLKIFTLLGGEVHWTLHNLLPHNAPLPKLQKLLRHQLWKIAHTIYVHHVDHKEWVQSQLGWRHPHILVWPHPNYELPAKAQKPSDLKATRFYLIYGQVAPYKHTLDLLRTLPDLPIVVAGVAKAEDSWTQKVRSHCLEHPSHQWIERRISPEEERWLHENTQGVLFGFDSILYSGGVHLAQQYQSPLFLPELTPLKHFDGTFYSDLSQLQSLIHSHSSQVKL